MRQATQRYAMRVIDTRGIGAALLVLLAFGVVGRMDFDTEVERQKELAALGTPAAGATVSGAVMGPYGRESDHSLTFDPAAGSQRIPVAVRTHRIGHARLIVCDRSRSQVRQEPTICDKSWHPCSVTTYDMWFDGRSASDGSAYRADRLTCACPRRLWKRLHDRHVTFRWRHRQVVCLVTDTPAARISAFDLSTRAWAVLTKGMPGSRIRCEVQW